MLRNIVQCIYIAAFVVAIGYGISLAFAHPQETLILAFLIGWWGLIWGVIALGHWAFKRGD